MNLVRDPLFLKRSGSRDVLYAGRPYRAGEIVLDFVEVKWRPERDAETVQHPSGGHIYHPVLASMAHSCEPNCAVDPIGRIVVAGRAILAGEAISCDYKATETRLASPFDCDCGSPACRGRIS